MGLHVPDWLSQQLHVSSSAGYAMVRQARELPSLPDTSAAFDRGDLSGQQASVVARCVQAVKRGGGDTVEAERRLLQQAEHYDPRSLFRWGLSLVHELAPREMETMEGERERSRYLYMREVSDGGYMLEGYLDPLGGDTLKTALDAVLGKKKKDDRRSPGLRRADGVIGLARRVLDSGQLSVRGGVRPHLMITAPLSTLMGDPGAPAALLNWGFPISGRALRKIAEDADIIPIAKDDTGKNPLSVGRRYRTATPKMRIALAERDRRCIWFGCNQPPERTEGHHEIAWAKGGNTEVARMSLLCKFHHGFIGKGWELTRMNDGQVFVHRSSEPGTSTHDPPPF